MTRIFRELNTFETRNVKQNATNGTSTQKITMTKRCCKNNTLYATPTPTIAPTVTSLVDSGMPSTFAVNNDSAADPIIMQTMVSVMVCSGMIPPLIVLTTSPPPITAPDRTPAAQMISAYVFFLTAPDP